MNNSETINIDVWDSTTFDAELVSFLCQHVGLVTDYLARDREIFLSHDLERGTGQSIMRPDNIFGRRYSEIVEAAGNIMQQRTIRAYHYTRLHDSEVTNFWQEGIVLSTPTSLRARLDKLIDQGELTAVQGDLLARESPFNSDQRNIREGRFWMTSHPIEINDSGVEPLLAHWGGEVANMWVQDEAVLNALARIGLPAIVEVAVPLDRAVDFGGAGRAVVATFARANGSTPEKAAFDLYAHTPLPADCVLSIHRPGDEAFEFMGRGYPANFVDVAIGRWKEVTGDDH